MKLYIFMVAPNPTRVRLMLAEKRAGGAEIDLPEVIVDLIEGEQKKPEHLARNPLAKLPVLELDDGSFLTESGAIMEYLEEIHPEPSMLGSSPLERARLRELDRIAEMWVLGSVAQLVNATNSPLGLPPMPDLAAQARDALAAPMKRLDDLLADGRPFVAGEYPSLADCTLQAAFQFARFREIEILDGYAQLARWDAAYRERDPARSVLVV
jgi:glutathione S-transferase